MVGADFVATGIFIVTKFEPVEGRSASQPCLDPAGHARWQEDPLYRHHGKEEIEPQKIMIIKILVACSQPQQTLATSSRTECSIKSGLRRSRKHPAKDREIPRPSSI